MTSTFHGIETARRGIHTHQKAIHTTGHNIANANTDGYSRQRVNMSASSALEVPALTRSANPGQLGTGVEATNIKRIREAFLDAQYRQESSSYQNWSTQLDTLQKVELFFNEPSDQGFRSVIDQFWNSFQDLSRDPENLETRAVVRERAVAMIDLFKYVDQKLTDVSNDLTDSLDKKVIEANTYIEQIADLNEKIRRAEAIGYDANDFRDKRDLLVDDLSKLVELNVQELPDGTYNVSASNGETLVDGIDTFLLDDAIALTSIYDDQVNGELYGIMYSRDVHINNYQEQVTEMFRGLMVGEIEITVPAGSVLPVDFGGVNAGDVFAADTTGTVEGINGLHELGWTLDSNAAEAIFIDNGGNAFGAGFSIQDVRLHADIVNSTGAIAASLRVDGNGDVFRGNGELALLMGQMRDTDIAFNSSLLTGPATFDEYLRGVLGQLGVQTQQAERQKVNIGLIMESVDNRRQSVSGVSLDEEMSMLIQYQHAYNGSARMMTTIDEMLDRVINNMGLVGR